MQIIVYLCTSELTPNHLVREWGGYWEGALHYEMRR